MKKGIVFSKLIAGILMIAGLIIAIMFVMKVWKTANNIVEDSDCKASILTHSTLLRTSGGGLPADIYCPTKYYTIPAKTEDEAKQALADALKVCYGTWGRGELILFSKESAFNCHICSIVSFSNKDMKFTDLQDYLFKNTITPGTGSSTTYAQYLSMTSTAAPSEEYLSKISRTQTSGMEIDTSKEYAVIFMYAVGSEKIQELLNKIAPANPAEGAQNGLIAGLAVFGAAYGAYAVGIISGPPGWITLAVVTVAGTVGGVTWSFLSTEQVDHIALPVLREYNADELTQLGCELAPTKQDKQQENLG